LCYDDITNACKFSQALSCLGRGPENFHSNTLP
jgi:hypothetical protein